MADQGKKPQFPRRNAPARPLPGVQKAMQNFGVRDLREILDKKHQDQGDSRANSAPDLNQKPPPPDPSYNYLKDPSRERTKFPSHKKAHDSNSQGEGKTPQERHPKHKDLPVYQPKRKQTERYIAQENNNNLRSKEPLTRHVKEEVVPKKEVHFADNAKMLENEPPIFSRGGRSSFTGRTPRQGRGGKHKDDRQEKIENPLNIKIHLSTETGQRCCTLDESTKIADILHVPDRTCKLSRGGKGSFRGRGRGRGSFSRKGNNRNKTAHCEMSEHSDKLGEEHKTQNNVEETTQVLEENSKDKLNKDAGTEYSENEQDTNKNEACADTNGKEDEFSSEYCEETFKPDDETEVNQKPEIPANSFCSNLGETITITSSKYKDGEVKRCVEVSGANDKKNLENNVENNNGNQG